MSLQNLLPCNEICLKCFWNNAENALSFAATKLKLRELNSQPIKIQFSMHILTQMFQ